jgi:hypothetical protein
MVHDTVGTVVNLTSCFAKPKTEINIFEAVAEMPCRTRRLASTTVAALTCRQRPQAGSAAICSPRMVGGESCINVTRITVLANHHARVLDSVVQYSSLLLRAPLPLDDCQRNTQGFRASQAAGSCHC